MTTILESHEVDIEKLANVLRKLADSLENEKTHLQQFKNSNRIGANETVESEFKLSFLPNTEELVNLIGVVKKDDQQ